MLASLWNGCWGAREVPAQQLRTHTALAEDHGLVPVPMSGGSQLPISTDPGDPMPLDSKDTDTHMYT